MDSGNEPGARQCRARSLRPPKSLKNEEIASDRIRQGAWPVKQRPAFGSIVKFPLNTSVFLTVRVRVIHPIFIIFSLQPILPRYHVRICG